MANILVLDDEIAILNLIENALTKSGHYVKKLNNPKEIYKEDLNFYHLIILDIMMPEIDGFEICSSIRQIVDCPILFLTAKTEEKDIIKGLGIGGDDYLTKPFGITELRARVAAHLRRENRERRNTFFQDEICFSISTKECLIKNEKLNLTKSEYEICELLALNRGMVFSKEKILESIYGYDHESDSAAIAEHIKNIRAKFKSHNIEPIKTVWGVGYKWELPKK
ncbi:MAG: response regulator transcription factor [Tissierellia bacterium]|nr:response regulator transcription factor [Tissierellia bacterium]